MSLVMQVDIDGIRATMRHFKAVEKTIEDAGVGTIYASARKKADWETRKPLHSRRILGIMARGGKWPLFPSQAEHMRIYRELKKKVEKAIERAGKTGHSYQRDVQRAVGSGRGRNSAAGRVFSLSHRRIVTGAAGKNTARRARNKTRYVKAGTATSAYGVPPPFLVDTGRLIRGLKARWAIPGGRRRR